MLNSVPQPRDVICKPSLSPLPLSVMSPLLYHVFEEFTHMFEDVVCGQNGLVLLLTVFEC